MPPLQISEFENRLPSLLRSLRTLVEAESPSTNKPALDRAGRLIAERMRRLGAEVRRYPQDSAGDHWRGDWGSGSGGILLLAHLDTVHPLGSLSRMPWRREKNRIFGPGILDMKGGLALGLLAIQALQETGKLPPRRVTMLINSDEEIGSDTSRKIIEELAKQHDLVLCLEPALPDGSLKTWRKGIGDFVLQTLGRASHAGGDPQNGINAILEMSHQIQHLMTLANQEAGTTISVGKIHGGSRTNVVPENCVAHVDIRVVDQAEQARVDRALKAFSPILKEARVAIEGRWNRPPMPRSPLIARTYSRAQAIAKGLGLKISEGGTGGGSDANFVAPLGVPLLDGLGAVGGGPHSDREYVWADQLPSRAAFLAAIISEW